MGRFRFIAAMIAGFTSLVVPGSALGADVVGTSPSIHVQSNTAVVHDLSVKLLNGTDVPGHTGEQHTAYLVDDGAVDMTCSHGACEVVNSSDGDGGKDAVVQLDDVAFVNSIELDGGPLGDTLAIDPSVPVNAALYGYPGNDTLIGGAHDDVLLGLDGNDVLDGRGGSDYMDGGTQTDTVTYATRSAPVRADLEPTTQGSGPYDDGGSADLSGSNLDAIASVERLIGGSGKDRLTGDGLANKLIGGGGNDLLKGLAGKDRLTGGGGKDRLTGGRANDVLKGSGANDILNGSGGKDKLLGGAGNDMLKARDHKRDKRINCGSGHHDSATVDHPRPGKPGDPAARLCETVI